jgi:murein DD-endopeptidase MepM/ murein hydrolase activator NlpD
VIFPFLGFGANYQGLVNDNTYIQGVGGAGGTSTTGFAHGVSFFACSWSGPVPPTTTISVCPVNAIITQCPNESFSHSGTDAYDFGSSQGQPIVAAHDGYVTQYVNTVPNNFFEHTYGNMVVLVGTNPAGQQFCTNYAHMMQNLPQSTIDAFNNKTLIKAGQIIGYSDTSGNTYGSDGPGTGTHLHFEYNGPGLMIVPPGCADKCKVQ